MKNIFDYATKELSQDAFLMWLFENFGDEELNGPCCCLLKEFCGIKEDEEIQRVETAAQYKHIDIKVKVETNKSTRYLYIEDKTLSEEHDQLKKYDEAIKETGEKFISKVYYKTSIITEKEKAALEGSGWVSYDINKIAELFGEFENSKNLILSQYISHIKELKSFLYADEIPSTSSGKTDYIKWAGFFYKLRELIIKDGRFRCDVYYGGRYGYSYIQIRLKDKWKIPYIELRSCYCLKGKFTVFLLCHGAESFEHQKEAIEKIKETDIMSTKIYKRSEYPKQIGKKEGIPFNSAEELAEKLKEYLHHYEEVMEVWEKGRKAVPHA